jgi:hypothetical protein
MKNMELTCWKLGFSQQKWELNLQEFGFGFNIQEILMIEPTQIGSFTNQNGDANQSFHGQNRVGLRGNCQET